MSNLDSLRNRAIKMQEKRKPRQARIPYLIETDETDDGHYKEHNEKQQALASHLGLLPKVYCFNPDDDGTEQ